MFPTDVKVIPVGFDDRPRLAATESSPDKAMNHYRHVRDETRTFIETLPGSLLDQADIVES